MESAWLSWGTAKLRGVAWGGAAREYREASMWRMVIESEVGDRTDLVLKREEYVLGRAEGNHVRLTERNVSRRHARLVRRGPNFVLEDLGSYNGTFVNAQLVVVGGVPLQQGDLIQIGEYRLLIQHEATRPPAVLPEAQAQHASSLGWRPPRLVMLAGPTPLAEFPLLKPRTTIGRREGVDIDIIDPSVSREHCELVALEGGRFEVVDLKSANGILVNGNALRQAILDVGDVLVLGEDVVLKYVGAGEVFRLGPNDLQPPPRRSVLPWLQALPYLVFVTIVIIGGCFAWVFARR
jgi:pSer/pThr/pTyr-binding forkhead associated (FHA) protein